MGHGKIPFRDYSCPKYLDCLTVAAMKNKKNLGCIDCEFTARKNATVEIKSRTRHRRKSGIEELEALLRLRDARRARQAEAKASL